MVFHRETLGNEYQIQTCDSHTFGHVDLHTFLDLKRGERLWNIGSCNGILGFECSVLITDDHCWEHCIHLYNPITREYRKLPPHTVPWDADWDIDAHGFGFDSRNNDYKVISIHELDEVEIYKLSTNCWSKLDVDLESIFGDGIGSICSDAVYVNGSCHWMFLNQAGEYILTFDFTTDTFDLAVLSMEYLLSSYERSDLGVLDNSLAVCGFKSLYTDIWVMSGHGNEDQEMVWTKRFSVRIAENNPCWIHGTFLFQLSTNGEVTVSCTDEDEEEEEITEFKLEFQVSAIFKPSLTSLGTGCFVPALDY